MLFLAGGIVCVILAVNQQFITLWLGVRFFGGMQLTVILLLTFLLRQADYTLAVTLFAFGHEKLLSIRALADGAISVAVAILLVRHWGMVGVAFGFLCGAVFHLNPGGCLFADSDTPDVGFGEEVIRPYLPYAWRFAVAGCAALADNHWFGSPNALHMTLTISIVGLVYLLLVIPYVWSTPLRGYIQGATAKLVSAMRACVLG